MAKKKKEPPKEPDYAKMPVLPNKLARFVQAKYGLTPDELLKLTQSLGRVNEDIKVARRRAVEGKEYSRRVGKILTILEAAEYEQERTEDRFVKDQEISELLEEVNFDELMVRLEVNDSIYPKRLAPTDIVKSIDAAGERLAELDRLRAKPPKIYSPREEILLDVITLIKKQEPYRVARHIADRQKAYILSHTMEELEAEYKEWLRILRGDPTEEELLAIEEARRLAEAAAEEEEERRAAEEAARNFGDLPPMHTLLDEVAELIRNNPEAATAIISLWIGNVASLEKAGNTE
jgi:sulfur carrier protein ThiS